MEGHRGIDHFWATRFQSGNHENDIPLTAYHYLQGQIGEQFAPTSDDAAHFNSWKKRAPDSGVGLA